MRRSSWASAGAGLILIMTMAGSAGAAGPSPKSAADISVGFSADCMDLTALSSKDISFVEIHFADGTAIKDEPTASPWYSYDGGVVITDVSIKSGTTLQTFDCTALPPDPGLD